MKDFLEGVGIAMSMPLYLQVALPCGYMGYLLARSGLKHKDDSITIIFMTLAFALSSLVLGGIISDISSVKAVWFDYVLILSIPLLTGVLWRKYIHRLLMSLLHAWRISNSTEFPDLWLEVTQNQKVAIAQVIVYLKDGDVLSCDDIYNFADAPISLFRTDQEGNVALYVTHRKSQQGDALEPVQKVPTNKADENPTYYRLTYIPKGEVKRIDFQTHRPI